MSAPSSSEVTGLLRAWGQGDEHALQKLMPLVYDQLHAAARRYMAGERAGHTLQTTALIITSISTKPWWLHLNLISILSLWMTP
jgi:hypothetical protein